MSFLYPSFLFALAAVGIPIIIHLFNFRRYKTVYFSNTKFLKEVKEQTDSRSRLKHLLILLCRILTIIFIVLAFAQPFIKRGAATEVAGRRTVSIFIDNSFSMGQTTADVPLVEIAKKKAQEIIASSNDDDLFQLLTNDFEGRQQRLIDKQEALNEIKEVQLSPAIKNISLVMQRQKEALAKGTGSKISFIISDFQKSFSDFSSIKVDSSIKINFLPLRTQEAINLYIDTCWFLSPVQIINQQATMLVRIVNKSGSEIEGSRLTMKVNDQIKAINEFSVDANGIMIDTLKFTITDRGWNKASLSVVDHPITFDDNYFVSFLVAENTGVMVINESAENPYVNALFGNNNFFTLSNVPFNQLNYSDLFKNQFVIINGVSQLSSGLSAELKTFLEKGGNVCLFPGASTDLPSCNSFLQSINADVLGGFTTVERNVTSVNTRDAVFANVFQRLVQNLALPKSNSSFSLGKRINTNAEPLLVNNDGSSFLTRYVYGKGIFYLCSVPLDKNYSDLPLNALFAPMMYNMAITKASSNANAYIIGEQNIAVVDVDLKSDVAALRLKGSGNEFIPTQRKAGSSMNIYLDQQMSESGFYTLQGEDQKDLGVFAMNYNRKESDLSLTDNEELKNISKALNITVIQNADRDLGMLMTGQKLGLPLWKVSVIFALIFIALEIALLKLWK